MNGTKGQSTGSVTWKFLLHLHPPKIPAESARLTYTFGLGGLSIFSFLLTLLSGLLLLFFYTPTPEGAYATLQQIISVQPYGWYLRSLHFWAGQVMVIAVVLHMVRVMSTGGYLSGRRFNWLIGLLLLVLTLLMDFTGFPLRWDVQSHWALVVGTNLIQSIPGIGTALYQLLVGGTAVGAPTLLRFYIWHSFGLPFFAVVLVIYHIYRIRKDGGISSDQSKRKPDRISREFLLQKELGYLLAISALIMLIAVFFAPDLNMPVGQGEHISHVEAPWIFMGIQFLLRHIPPVIAGIAIPLGVLLLWGILPYLDRHDVSQGIWFAPRRKIFWVMFLTSLGVIVISTLMESLVNPA